MNNPKQVIIQLGALFALYVNIVAILVLIFSIINVIFPDAAEYYYQAENARASMRTTIAILVVFFPAYLALTRYSNQLRRKENNGEYAIIGKWLVYMSLLVAGGIMLGDLVVLIVGFLNGELTTRFILKVLALLLVIGLASHYYILDIRGHFKKRVDQSLYFGMGAVVLVVASILYGFANIETPEAARELRIDQNQVSDLQDTQWRIEEYYRANESLPPSFETLYGAFEAPAATEGRADYRYEVTSETTYQLCAEFADDVTGAIPKSPETRSTSIPGIPNNYNWDYLAGDWCFERIIDKEYRQ